MAQSTSPQVQLPPSFDGYNVSLYGLAAVPACFLNARCARFFVEFLSLADSETPTEEARRLKNHAVLKIDFDSVVSSYRGVRVGMEADYDLASEPGQGGTSYKPGKMLVRPVSYAMASYRSLRTVEVQVQGIFTLYHYLRAIVDNRVEKFLFVNINEKYYGCRDFM